MSRFSFDAARIRAAILAGVDDGLARITAGLGATVKRMLSTQGRGRVYVRDETHKGKTRLSAKAIRSARKAGVPISFFSKPGGGGSISRGGLASILRQRRLSGKSHRTLRSLGFHKASAPGDPPAVDTGHLRRSWQAGFAAPSKSNAPGRRVFRVGSNLPYARLEFGMGKVKPRPYLRPSAKKVQSSAQAVMNDAISASLRRAGL